MNGVPIVPNVRWGDERTYAFAFEGIPRHSTVTVGSNGCMRGKLDRHYFRKGLAEMIDTLKPSAIINYGQTPEDVFGAWRQKGIPILSIENHHATARKRAL